MIVCEYINKGNTMNEESEANTSSEIGSDISQGQETTGEHLKSNTNSEEVDTHDLQRLTKEHLTSNLNPEDESADLAQLEADIESLESILQDKETIHHNFVFGGESMQESIDKLESNLKEARELFFETNKQWMIDEALKGFRVHLDTCKNGDNAEKLIALKLSKIVEEKTSEWVENGGPMDEFYVEISLQIAKSKDKDGTELKFITGVNMEIVDNVDNINNNELLTSEEQNYIAHQKRDENLTEEKKAS